jgi:hypothetical protein
MRQSISAAKNVLARAKFDPQVQPEQRRAASFTVAPRAQSTYLTTDELAARIKYDSRTIRERLKDSVLLEGIHYIRPFGGRKILFIWERIEEDMGSVVTQSFAIPMANGGVCHG